MSAESTANLVRELARNLAPVRPMPRLRTSAAAFFVLWLALFGYQIAVAGLRHDLLESLASLGSYFAVSVGLCAAGIGGVLAGLASGVPGRESVRNWAGGVAIAGIAIAALVCGTALLRLGFAYGSPVYADGACLRASVFFAALPIAALAFATSRGWAGRPYVAAAVALLGAVASAALVVQLSCPEVGPRHLLLGHLSAPVLLVSLGVLPLGFWLRRTAR